MPLRFAAPDNPTADRRAGVGVGNDFLRHNSDLTNTSTVVVSGVTTPKSAQLACRAPARAAGNSEELKCHLYIWRRFRAILVFKPLGRERFYRFEIRKSFSGDCFRNRMRLRTRPNPRYNHIVAYEATASARPRAPSHGAMYAMLEA